LIEQELVAEVVIDMSKLCHETLIACSQFSSVDKHKSTWRATPEQPPGLRFLSLPFLHFSSQQNRQLEDFILKSERTKFSVVTAKINTCH
jgi:hypothetical protein